MNFANSNQLNDNDDVFDLSIEKDTISGKVVSIDVFKSTKNDAIIETNDQAKYNRLEWFSIGDPQLTQNNNQPFKFTASGFYMKIEMLTNLDA